MGANLLLAYLPAAKITKQRRRVLHRLVTELRDQDANCEEITSLADDHDTRQMLHEHVNLLPANPWEHRDMAEMALPHMPYPLVFTGGVSWGDSPGELFEPFCCLGVLPTIYRQLRIWALDDEKRRRSKIGRRKSA
ncbi:MAG TPA: hypothetical protein VGM05_11425 [Planctomycetaceae bacterium]|jgi:hypothetical protein